MCSFFDSVSSSLEDTKPLNTGGGNSSECKTGQIVDGILGKQKLSHFFPKVNPFAFILSNPEAFLYSCGTQTGKPIFFLDHQEQHENMLYKHASQNNKMLRLRRKHATDLAK